MGRVVRRVPLDFEWPLNKVWEGFLLPDRLTEEPCSDCKGGYSARYEQLQDRWYGNAPFNPAETGSTPFTADTRAARELAERNVSQAPDFYGTGEAAILWEATRLANLWNDQWGHHLAQGDVDLLVEEGRLRDFTHTWSRETGWQAKVPAVRPTAAEVNEWSLRGMGHDSSNAYIVCVAHCKREGVPSFCTTCDGHGLREVYPGQRAEAEAWVATDPPAGEGWQLWETVSEGSPVSPVFATSDALAVWMSDPARGTRWVPQEAAAKFIADGWAPSFVSSPKTGVVSGVEWVGHSSER
ncbi:hypothetical protein ABZ694_24930 [Streptomyces albidoflavus]|uniref:hypothetical protein n=1 Tax=Streptomyces albidoflavus TaxID=1886 RepID=UPI003407C871